MTESATDPYKRLAATLDKIPNSFTHTEEGTHLKFLQWIYSPEEADLASKMKLRGETVEELAARLDIAIEGLANKLEDMVKKGQIRVINTSTGRRFAIFPVVVGIYEEQLNRMDAKFAQIVEDHFQTAAGKDAFFEIEPAIFKVIPINRVIDPKLTIHTYEQVEEIINQAKSWGIRECICKKQQKLLGNPCRYPTTVCLTFSRRENAYDDHTLSKPASKEQALELLLQAEKAGLVHCSMNIQTGHYYICNCCTCCCMILRGLTERNQPNAFVKSNFQMQVDAELCSGCETCVDRCQFDALELNNDGICDVNLARCVGCGVCATECPEEALSLVDRPPEKQTTPPETQRDWMTQKAMNRHVDPSELL